MGSDFDIREAKREMLQETPFELERYFKESGFEVEYPFEGPRNREYLFRVSNGIDISEGMDIHLIPGPTHKVPTIHLVTRTIRDYEGAYLISHEIVRGMFPPLGVEVFYVNA